MNRLDVLYLTYLESPFDRETAGILHSQVISLLVMLKRIQPKLRIGWFAMVGGERNRKLEEDLKKALQEAGVLLEILYLGQNVPKWKQLSICLKHVIKYRKKYAPKVVHCRSYIASLLAIISRQICKNQFVKIIFDARAAAPEEAALGKGFVRLFKYLTLKLIERYLLMKSDFVVCVSQEMIAHFQQIRKTANYVCIPTGVDTNVFKYQSIARNQIRASLGLSDNDIVVTYSGGLKAWWHSPNLIASTVFYLSNFIDFHFLLLTRSDTEDLIRLLKKNSFNLNRISTYALHPHDVHAYLSASDFGLLVREESIVNKVAFPTKFAEYLACGLPVIATHAVADVALLITQYKIGYLLNKTTSESEVQSSLRMLLNTDAKQRCIETSKKYSIQESAKSYIMLYMRAD